MRFVSWPPERGFWMDFSGPLFQLWSNLEQEEDLLDYGGHEGALENRTKSAPGSSGTGMMGLRQRAAGLCGRGRQATRTKAVLRPASGASCFCPWIWLGACKTVSEKEPP